MNAPATDSQTYTLLGADGPFESTTPGDLAGNRRAQIYGRLDCPSALKAKQAGGYASHRVFFRDEATAVSLGYRPCNTCMQDEYREWKASRQAKA